MSSLLRLWFILTRVLLFGGEILVRSRLLPLFPEKWKLRQARLGAASPDELIRIRDHRFVVSPRRLRGLLEELGPTFVKLGQVLSLRPDLVGQELSQELSRLQSQVSPFAFQDVKRIIAEEFRSPSDAVFAELDPIPVAAASLAQVHRARLGDGTAVAIKVQRPGIRKIIGEDIRLLGFLARLADHFFPEMRPYQPRKFVREFADWAERELDFVIEGHNAERFRFAFRENPYIKIPTIFWEFTTPRILTMELVEGVRADDVRGIDARGLDRRELALHGVDAQLQQFLLDGFFHGDPHPGNSFALEGNVLCFYDFGIAGYLNEGQRKELLSCFVAFAYMEIEAFLRHFLHLCRHGPQSDIPAFYKDASAILAEIFFSPTSSSLAWVFFRLINRAAARQIQVPADLALFGKALITTEAMGKTLYPEFDFAEHLTPFVAKAFRVYLDPVRLRRSLTGEFFDWMGIIRELPSQIKWIGAKTGKSVPDTEITPGHTGGDGQSARAAYLRLAQTTLPVIGLILGMAALAGSRPGHMVPSIAYLGIAAFSALFFLFFLKAVRR